MKAPSSKTVKRTVNAMIKDLQNLKLRLGVLDRLPKTRENRRACIRINKVSREMRNSMQEVATNMRLLLRKLAESGE